MIIRVGMIGLQKVQKKIERLPAKAKNDLDGIVERRALMMVNDTRNNAPKDTGKLANSIDIIPSATKSMYREYGSNVEYARRQEFEHKTKKGYFRKTVAKHRTPFINDVMKYLKNW